MTIDNFENQVNPTILKRGRDYFKNGLVGELDQDDNNWTAEVYGSEDYLVEITLDAKGEISEYFCDCPFDGDLCKHVVATCYAIREEMAKRPKTKSAKATDKPKKTTFEDLLEKISLDEYKNFIRNHARQDKNFRTQFELFFSDKDDNLDVEQKYRDLFRKLTKKYSTRGFIEYRSSRGFSQEIDEIIDKGMEMIVVKNFVSAFLLGKAILKEMITIYPNCDDSNGDIGGSFYTIVDLFETLSDADQAALTLKQQIFDFLKSELANKDYFDYGDFGYDLFGVFHNLALQLRRTDSFVEFIDNRCKSLTGKYDDYKREFLLKEKIDFYRETGHDLADVLISQNMDIVEIRKAEVDKAISQKNYTEAKRLIAEGIKIAEGKGHPGTVDQWKKELLRIAVLENDMKTVRQLTHYFAFDRGFNKEYYVQWRQTYPKSEWTDIIEKRIADTTKEVLANHKKSIWNKDHNPPLLRSLAPIMIEEKYWGRLLTLVQAEHDLDSLLYYHKHLVERYPKELLALYLPEFKHVGDRVDGRSQYAELARRMIKVMKDIPEGIEKIQAVARELIALNPRRPAMIDELNKVLKV